MRTLRKTIGIVGSKHAERTPLAAIAPTGLEYDRITVTVRLHNQAERRTFAFACRRCNVKTTEVSRMEFHAPQNGKGLQLAYSVSGLEHDLEVFIGYPFVVAVEYREASIPRGMSPVNVPAAVYVQDDGSRFKVNGYSGSPVPAPRKPLPNVDHTREDEKAKDATRTMSDYEFPVTGGGSDTVVRYIDVRACKRSEAIAKARKQLEWSEHLVTEF